MSQFNLITVATDCYDGQAVIMVRDEGRGMNEERKKRYGQPQYSSKPGGTGVGTAVARRFVNEMGGELRLINSALGLGSNIKVFLRLAAKSRG